MGTPASFKPGQSGNPHGRPPKEWTMKSLLLEAAEEMDETGTPKKVIIARKLMQLAAKGDMQAIKEFNNRTDGMPQQYIENSGDMSLNIKIVDDKEAE
jgi:hypothetical protein